MVNYHHFIKKIALLWLKILDHFAGVGKMVGEDIAKIAKDFLIVRTFDCRPLSVSRRRSNEIFCDSFHEFCGAMVVQNGYKKIARS